MRPSPKGADTVVKVEDTEHTPESVRVFKAESRGANIRPQGEDVKQAIASFPKELGSGPVKRGCWPF